MPHNKALQLSASRLGRYGVWLFSPQGTIAISVDVCMPPS
jgi:hypothetical protein